MARKRTQAHRAEIDNTKPADLERKDPALETHEKRVRHSEAIQKRADEERVEEAQAGNPHYGVRPDDLAEQVRPMSAEDPAAEMPAAVAEARERHRGAERHARGVPEADHDFRPAPVDKALAEPPPRPEYRHLDPAELGDYTVLARGGDIAEAGLQDVNFAEAHDIDPSAPLAGEEGGAPLGEETEDKHHPGAPWPAPLESFADAPTASPQPGPEPAVQYNPPQDVEYRDKPEAARGVAVDQTPPEPEEPPPETEGGRKSRREARTQRYTTREPEPDTRKHDDTPRDEAGQVSIDHMAELALEGVGSLFQGLEGEEVAPYRLQKALELAARKVMSPWWWELRERFFVSRETPREPEPQPEAA